MRRFAVVLLFAALMVAGCGESSVIVRSDPSMNGYKASMLYEINASPDGASEKNEIVTRGLNEFSPMPMLSTSFGKGANSRTQTAQITDANGTAVNVLSMNKWGINVGLTDYLETQIATYDQRDQLGNRVCGAKVRLDFKPNIAQFVLHDKYRRAWNTLFYYTIPCADTPQVTATLNNGEKSDFTKPAIVKPNMALDLNRAKFLALVIDQQTTPRVTGKPIIFNRGHSVTVVGGRASRYVGGWWQSVASLLNASHMVTDMVKDLDHNQWLKFSNPDNGGLVYSAGDADVYASLGRIFLNRQSAYLVNFRSSPSEKWRRVLVNPRYNIEWNDMKQTYHALTGDKEMPDIDEMVDDKTNLPKDVDNPDSETSKALKELETAGCQNCPNPTLEQLEFIDATDGSPNQGEPIYAATIRGYLGSTRSLVMFGKVPGSLKSYQDQAVVDPNQRCQIQRDLSGEKLDATQQYTKKTCAMWLRESAVFDLITKNASKFGFDVVAQFSVEDNSSWGSDCDSDGYCTIFAVNRRLNGAYMFTDTGEKLQKAWTIMQLLGEVGMRTLGMSYASGQYDGSGLDFAMAQPQVYNSYYTDMSDTENPYNPELLFALDARALQLPTTLGLAREYLGLK